MKYLITGGAGFIGSNFIRYILELDPDSRVINLDKLTYAGNRDNLLDIQERFASRYRFIQGDITDCKLVAGILSEHKPERVINFAAESHVDRSIDGPAEFIQTNIVGTFTLLEEAFRYFQKLAVEASEKFRFLHVSTDEVFGELGKKGKFTETSRYDPRSPYSASKASSDFLTRAWAKTYELPVLITNCSNNYGPYQFPEKLIPLMIINALTNRQLPVYGKGENIRDWVYVTDHCRGIQQVLRAGRVGETYNIGGNCERKNLEVVNAICDILDDLKPRPDGRSYRDQVEFVQDRPGHDFRYAIDISKIKTELGWQPRETFSSGMRKTVQWYLDNEPWWRKLQERYQQERLGKGR